MICDKGVVTDTSINPSAAILNGNALAASSYVSDHIPPSLLAFDLDMTHNTLTMIFSEVVRASSLKLPTLTLWQFSNGNAHIPNFSNSSYTLSYSSYAQIANGVSLTVFLASNDTNSIKLLPYTSETAPCCTERKQVALVAHKGVSNLMLLVSLEARNTVRETPFAIWA